MGTMRCFTLWISLFVTLSAQATPIVLNTDIFPPYQVRTEDGLEGSSVRALACVFDAMQQPYTIKIMPWERAIYEVEHKRADGFFSATKMIDADSYATLSAPLALEKWYWYTNMEAARPNAELSAPRTGAIRGSNQLIWLQQQGVKVDQLAGSTEQLLKLLARGRIDRFMADHRTLRTELIRQPVDLRPQYEHFYKYATLGVYFSNRLLARKPELLKRFNQHVFYCLDETPSLDNGEKSTLLNLHKQLYAHWASRAELLSAVKQQNQHHNQLSIANIVTLDGQWRREIADGTTPMVDALLARDTSRWLKIQQNQSDGLITEIMLTDRLGLLVAASERTTDYWQGDEAKFSEAFFALGTTSFISELNYDQSTGTYQVHISIPVREPEHSEIIGTLIIGLNIERALRKADTGDTL